jgi:hypothetical protein
MAIPSDIANLQGWWKADSESYNEGDPVGTMTDRSGNARNATQAVAGAKPTFKKTIAPGSMAAYSFDGGDVCAAVAISNFVSVNQGTAYCFFRHGAISTNDTANYFNNNGVWGDGGGFTGLYLRSGGGTPKAISYNFDGTQDVAEKNMDTDWHLVVFQHASGTDIKIWVDDVTDAAVVTAASGPTTDLTNAMNIGAGTSATTFMTGEIAELFIYSATHNEATRLSMAAYVAVKYASNRGVLVNLIARWTTKLFDWFRPLCPVSPSVSLR